MHTIERKGTKCSVFRRSKMKFVPLLQVLSGGKPLLINLFIWSTENLWLVSCFIKVLYIMKTDCFRGLFARAIVTVVEKEQEWMTRDLDMGICSVCLLLSAQLGSLIKAWWGGADSHRLQAWTSRMWSAEWWGEIRHLFWVVEFILILNIFQKMWITLMWMFMWSEYMNM